MLAGYFPNGRYVRRRGEDRQKTSGEKNEELPLKQGLPDLTDNSSIGTRQAGPRPPVPFQGWG